MQRLTAAEIPVREYHIDTMPNLSARLGKARTDRIRYINLADTNRDPGFRNIPNTLVQFMQHIELGAPGCWVDDIIQGVVRLDYGNSIQLSASRLLNILQCVEMINTREVMKLMGVEKRQAQKYIKATKLAMDMIHRQLARTSGDARV